MEDDKDYMYIKVPKKEPDPISQIRQQPKIKGIRWYHYVTAIISIISLIALGIVVVSLKSIGLLVLYIFFAIPLGAGSVIFFFIRILKDKKHLKNTIIKKTSSNFLIAKFFKEQGRIEDVAVILNNDGSSFNYDKGLYTVDGEQIYKDSFGNPCSFYLKGLPNPLKFNFKKYMTFAMDHAKAKNGGTIKDWEGDNVDIAYSSKSLEKFKKDKIFEDFHRNPTADKITMILLGLNALSFIVIVIMVIFLQK